jgi:hypothetical protein
MLKGNYWPPLEVVAESGNKGGDNEENNDAIEDPLGSPSVLSSVKRVLFANAEPSMTSPVFLSICMHSCVHETTIAGGADANSGTNNLSIPTSASSSFAPRANH